ncbi:MAG TPA: hypothetical protein VIV11_20850 [Kofleriaceae bacterium]
MRFAFLLVPLLACGETSTPQPDATGSRQWALNDVSIMFPLPANETERARLLWLMPRAGEQGPFFPAAQRDQLPDLNGDVPDSAGYPAAMITSLRFDPCFPRLGGESCQAQLRLVAQPVLTNSDGITMLDDAAAHLFYVLSPTEAETVLAKLAAIRVGSPASTDGPLGVHPGLAADIAGATGAAVRALVVDHCRDDNFIRITTNSFAFDNWGFARFDREGATLARQALPGMETAETSQAWLRQAQRYDLNDPSGTITPRPVSGFTYLLSKASYSAGAPVDPAFAEHAAATLLSIENPTLTDSEYIDCASCHLATQARLFASRNGVTFAGANKYVPPAGVDTSLTPIAQLDGNLGVTIAFGYHMQDDGIVPVHVPSISQRTINESAAIVEFLRR